MKKISEWPYWLKGGLFSFIVLTAMSCAVVFGPPTITEGPLGLFIFVLCLPVLYLAAQLGFAADFIFSTGQGYETIGGWIVVMILVYYFFIGAFLGLIIGKIKSGLS